MPTLLRASVTDPASHQLQVALGAAQDSNLGWTLADLEGAEAAEAAEAVQQA